MELYINITTGKYIFTVGHLGLTVAVYPLQPCLCYMVTANTGFSVTRPGDCANRAPEEGVLIIPVCTNGTLEMKRVYDARL